MQFLTLASILASAQSFNLLNFLTSDVTSEIFSEDISRSNLIPFPGGSPIEQCEAGRPQLLQVENVVMDPVFPQAGKTVTITADGNLLAPVTAGSYVDLFVKYGTYKVFKNRYDLCSYTPEVGYECPTGPGPVSISKEIDLPYEMTSGEYLIIAKAYTATGELLTCAYSNLFVSAADVE